MKHQILRLLIGAVLCMFVVPCAYGDPLTFSNVVALQNGGATQVNLFDNPGAIVSGSSISFLVTLNGTLPNGGIDTLEIRFSEAGQAPVTQTFSIPVFPGVTLPYSQIFTFNFLNVTPLGSDATLRLDILGSSADFVIPSGSRLGELIDSNTYTITAVQPVPEPATILLLASGIIGLTVKKRRSRTHGTRPPE